MVNAQRPLILQTENSSYLAKEVFDQLGGEADIADIKIERFANGEWYVEVPHIRGRRIYVFHSPVVTGSYSPDTFCVQAHLIDDAIRRTIQDGFITYVTPHLPYQRKDRQGQEEPRTPISSRRMMMSFFDPYYPLPTSMITFDMHNDAIAGQVPYHIDHLYASPVLLARFREREDIVFVSPDVGAAKRTRAVAKKHAPGTEIIIVDKRRPQRGAAEVVNLVGPSPAPEKTYVMYDDLCDRGGTIIGGSSALRKEGAVDIFAAFTHPVFSPDTDGVAAESKLRTLGTKVVTTNSIWRGEEYARENAGWLEIVSLGPLIADAISHIERGESVSDMFR